MNTIGTKKAKLSTQLYCISLVFLCVRVFVFVFVFFCFCFCFLKRIRFAVQSKWQPNIVRALLSLKANVYARTDRGQNIFDLLADGTSSDIIIRVSSRLSFSLPSPSSSLFHVKILFFDYSEYCTNVFCKHSFPTSHRGQNRPTPRYQTQLSQASRSSQSSRYLLNYINLKFENLNE